MIEVENKNYIDVTEEWINNENIRKGRVINRSYYKDKEDNKYRVDGKNVVLDYSIKEKEVAEWLITKFGGNSNVLVELILDNQNKTVTVLENEKEPRIIGFKDDAFFEN